MMTEAKFFQKLNSLAQTARPIDDDDWGSERQVTAQNAFFVFVEANMHPMTFEEFESWCLKATSDEMIDEAIRLLKEE